MKPGSASAREEPDRLRASDGWAAVAVAVVAAAVFVSAFSSHVALGDAPESVSGIKTLGVVHAPGYPAYVLSARAFVDIVPIGGWALRVNLFSLVCATLMVSVVYLLARSFGSGVSGALVASLALATTASFWFNAGFAKHYAFSGLLVALGALLAVAWQQHGRDRFLIASGVVLGAGFGASWELALIMTVGVAVLVGLGRRRPRLIVAVVAVAGLLLVATAGLVFMVWRAGHDPAVNWGDVTSLGRLIEQITQRDFQSQGPAPSGVGGVLGSIPGRFVTYVAIIGRDVGFGAVAVAVIGGGVAAARLTRDRKLFLAVVGIGNLLAVVLVAGIDHIKGFFTGMFAGGFLLDALVVITVLAALGITWILEAVDDWALRRGHALNARGNRVDAGRFHLIVVGLLAMALVAPSLVTHYRLADHRIPPLADLYARRVLTAVPPKTVLIVGGYEFSEPMSYRQIVDRDRPDVTIVSADLLGLTWYHDELARRMRLRSAFETAPKGTSNGDETVRLVKLVGTSRPVYLDTIAMAFLGTGIGYQADGFVGRVVDGTGPHANASPDEEAAVLMEADKADGLAGARWPDFPNQFVYYFHQRAHIELAKQFLLQADTPAVESQLQQAHTLVPSDTPTSIALTLLQQHDSRANAYIRSL